MIQIMIVDDQPITRAAIREILETDPTFNVISETGSGEQAIEIASNMNLDVILMDIKMPNLNGVETTKKFSPASRKARLLRSPALRMSNPPKKC